MAINSKRKGTVGERDAVHFLNSLGYDTHRTSQVSGRDSADIEGIEGLHLEIKRQEKVSIEQWLQQSERDAGYTGGLPIVMHRRNRESWKVTLRAKVYFTLWEMLIEAYDIKTIWSRLNER